MSDLPQHDAEPTAEAAGKAAGAPDGREAQAGRLPTFAQRLLRIRLPAQVILASQSKSIQDITELGPGSIIKFDKTCDEPLVLIVGDRPLAHGEVVKVGDKFGLRISGLITR